MHTQITTDTLLEAIRQACAALAVPMGNGAENAEAFRILSRATAGAPRTRKTMIDPELVEVIPTVPRYRPARAVARAMTAAEILQPVGRRNFGKTDRVMVLVEATFADGEVIRLSVGRHPKDSDALALEAGRRMAVLFRARTLMHDRCAEMRAIVNEAYDRIVFDPDAPDYEPDTSMIRRRIAISNAAIAFGDFPDLVWHDVAGRQMLSYPAAIIETSLASLAECRIVAPDSLYSLAAD